MCKANDVIIVNGRTGHDRNIGDVTFKGHNGSSTIDYCVTTPNIIPHIQDFKVDILDQNLSDKHSPIILTLKTKHSTGPINQNEITVETDIEYEQINSNWNDDKKGEFQSNFDQNKIQNLIQTLEAIDTNGADQLKINNVVKDISNVSIMAGINTNISKKATNNKRPQKNKKNRKNDKPWFDNECRAKRKHSLQIKRRIIRKNTKSQTDTKMLNHEAKTYKKFIQMKTNLYNKNLHDKLRNLKTKNLENIGTYSTIKKLNK